MARHITISSFKAQCLGLLEEVAQTGEELVVTKRGQPLARVLSAREAPSLVGSVDYLVSDEELIAPVAQDWDAAPR
ncbi:MAG: type II toxin-antitoxin system Phd/YefM family antitoxin [Chloroflexi bacterium]|nr:type II toxin-antitoxin system Phd/YefM family antitoxin [Chloroflexota bacterium]